MAKQTETPVRPNPAGAIVAAGNSTQLTDTRTGEVFDANANPGRDAAEAFDANIAAQLSANNLAGLLDAASKAKTEEFTAPEKDFWKPTEAGTPGAVLQGIYLGSGKVGRLIQHAVAVKSARDGKPTVMRLNGTHGLTRELSKLTAPCGVRIEYKGKTGTLSGTAFNQWDVRKLGQ